MSTVRSAPFLGLLTAVAALLECNQPAAAFVYKVIHNFDGVTPADPGGLIADESGNFFGTTYSGGTGCGGAGCGTVFEISSRGKETVLYRFLGGTDGSGPVGELARDASGNLYGATSEGGSTECGDANGCGTIFRLSPDGKYTSLYAFGRVATDGYQPNGDLAVDSSGNVYGTTIFGGSTGCDQWGCGTAFKVTPNGSETILYTFQGGADGAKPSAGLLRDSSGNLFGTTFYGGDSTCYRDGCGVVFELPVSGGEKVLHAFHSSEGYFPVTGVTQDAAGNLYGGTGSSSFSILYRVSLAGDFKVLFKFATGNDPNGNSSSGNLLLDNSGDIFVNNSEGGTQGRGVLFELAADGSALALHEFGAWAQDGSAPQGRPLLVQKKQKQRLYGVTAAGGKNGKGAVWVRNL